MEKWEKNYVDTRSYLELWNKYSNYCWFQTDDEDEEEEAQIKPSPDADATILFTKPTVSSGKQIFLQLCT